MTTVTEVDIDYPEMDQFMNESSSDVVFLVEEQRVPALKQILGSKSRVFSAMFYGNFKESQKLEDSKPTEVVIKETTIDAFKTLIHFINTDELVFKDDNDLQHICDVYQLSDRYEVLRLGDYVLLHFYKLINVNDLLSITRVVCFMNCEEMIEIIVLFMKTNINDLVERDVSELRELNDLTHNELLDVLTETIENYSFYDLTTRQTKLMSIKRESNNINAFKTFVGYIYLNQLILKDDNDFELIREVCRLSKTHNELSLVFNFIGKHLEERISVLNLSTISKIGFDYNMTELLEKVIDFKGVKLRYNRRSKESQKLQESKVPEIEVKDTTIDTIAAQKNHKNCKNQKFPKLKSKTRQTMRLRH